MLLEVSVLGSWLSMRVAKIEKNSVANGPGVRVVVWCQGCSVQCPGCHNKSTWDSNGGEVFTCSDGFEVIEMLKFPWVDGLTLSGGHPLEPYNIDMCTELCKGVKDSAPDKSIWLYTGWFWEDIKHVPIFQFVDVVVDGPYIDTLRDISLPYCGSTNQRVIDVKASLGSNEIVLYKEP